MRRGWRTRVQWTSTVDKGTVGKNQNNYCITSTGMTHKQTTKHTKSKLQHTRNAWMCTSPTMVGMLLGGSVVNVATRASIPSIVAAHFAKAASTAACTAAALGFSGLGDLALCSLTAISKRAHVAFNAVTCSCRVCVSSLAFSNCACNLVCCVCSCLCCLTSRSSSTCNEVCLFWVS